MAATAASIVSPSVQDRSEGWLLNETWDSVFLLGSAVLVFAPIVLHHALGLSTDAVNMLVAALIGGPHLFSTFTMTYLDRGFVRRHPLYVGLSFLLPATVVSIGLADYRLLLTIFFFWASLHVLHQIAFVADCYRERAQRPEVRWARAVDYGVIFTSLYPVGMYQLVHGRFKVGGEVLYSPIPSFIPGQYVVVGAAITFGALVALFLWKTLDEWREGRLNRPKTQLIATTIFVSLLVPALPNLDIAFQGYNTWHSFQYMFLFWLVNRLRFERGEIESGLVRRLAAPGHGFLYYGFFLLLTGSVVLLVTAVLNLTSLGPERSYFIVILSALLIHYYFDHFFFTQPKLLG